MNFKRNGIECRGSMLILRIFNTKKLFEKYKEKATHFINQVYQIFHTWGVIYFGDIDNKSNSITWKENREAVMKQFKRYVENLVIPIEGEQKKLQNLENRRRRKSRLYELGKKEKEKEYDTIEAVKLNPFPENDQWSQDLVIHLALLTGIKFIFSLYQDMKSTLEILRESETSVSLFLHYGNLFTGYIGNDIRLDQIILSSNIVEAEKILSSIYHQSEMKSSPNVPLYLHSDFYSKLHPTFMNYVFPCEHVKSISSSHSTEERKISFFLVYRQFLDYGILNEKTRMKSGFSYKKEEIFRKRQVIEQFTKHKRIHEHLLLEDRIFKSIVKDPIPAQFVTNVNTLFGLLKEKKFGECTVQTRKIKKEYGICSDELPMERLESLLKDALVKKKNIFKFKNHHTVLIKF